MALWFNIPADGTPESPFRYILNAGSYNGSRFPVCQVVHIFFIVGEEEIGHIQGFNIVFWGFGVQFLRPGEHRFQFKKIFSAPFVSLLIAMLFIAANIKMFLPEWVMRSTELLGNCTLPIAVLSLGMILAEAMSAKVLIRKSFFLKVLISKLIVMPAIVMIIIIAFKLQKFIALLLLIQALMPSAINLGVVSFYQKAKYALIGRVLLITYLFAAISIPFFLALFSMRYKF